MRNLKPNKRGDNLNRAERRRVERETKEIKLLDGRIIIE